MPGRSCNSRARHGATARFAHKSTAPGYPGHRCVGQLHGCNWSTMAQQVNQHHDKSQHTWRCSSATHNPCARLLQLPCLLTHHPPCQTQTGVQAAQPTAHVHGLKLSSNLETKLCHAATTCCSCPTQPPHLLKTTDDPIQPTPLITCHPSPPIPPIGSTQG
jgi:hypothetical protein